MCVCVVADGMAALENRGHDFGMAKDFFADEKKRDTGARGFEQIENFGRALRVGSIIDGEPNFTTRRGETRYDRSECSS